jgi:hypothetical protein
LRPRSPASSFLGSFNPSIFQPAWLVSNGLLRKEEADSAKIQIIHPEVTAFTASWLQLNVTQETFAATSEDPNGHELVRDFVAGAFRLLEHTPLRGAGLNHAYQYSFPSFAVNERLGGMLVPSAPWPFLTDPRWINLQVTDERKEGRPGRMNVRLEPSALFENGLFIAVNDHYDLEKQGDQVAALAGVELLAEEWDPSRERAENVATGLIANLD